MATSSGQLHSARTIGARAASPRVLPTEAAPPQSAPTPMSGRASKRPLRGAAYSASPRGRPHHLRPMKGEAATAKLRLAAITADEAALQSVLDSTAPDSKVMAPDMPGLHEGFYDFAAAVVRPQLTAREHATQLLRSLEAALREAQGPPEASIEVWAKGSRPDANAVRPSKSTARDASLLALPPRLEDHLPAMETFATAIPEGCADEGSLALVPTVPVVAFAQKASDRASKHRRASVGGANQFGNQRAQEAAKLQQEAQICVDFLEQYIKETTTDSKERGSFLAEAKRAGTQALGSLVTLAVRCVADAEAAESAQQSLQQAMDELQEENAGLRTMMQHMLSMERELKSEADNQQLRTEAVEQQLDDAHRKIQALNDDLDRVTEDLRWERDEKSRKRQTRDGCNSPMMGFSAFVMAPELYGGSDDAVHDPRRLTFSEGGIAGTDKRRTVTGPGASRGSVDPRPSVLHVHEETTRIRLSNVSPREMSPSSRQSPTTGAAIDHLADDGAFVALDSSVAAGSVGDYEEMCVCGHVLLADSIFCRKCGLQRGDPGRSTPRHAKVQAKPSDVGSDMDLSLPESHPISDPGASMATSFPALIPFLDFSKVDGGDMERAAQAETAKQNKQHLSKHIAALQEDYQKEVDQKQALQQSVDAVLERLLVWVHAIHDSISNGGFGDMVLQDTDALSVCKSALEWLVGRPCVDWETDEEHYEHVLDEHEADLREHLAKERPHNAELQDLKRELAQQKKRGDELSDQLLEVRSSMLGGRSLVKRPSGRTATAALPESAPGTSTTLPQNPVPSSPAAAAGAEVSVAVAHAPATVSLVVPSALLGAAPVGDGPDAAGSPRASRVQSRRTSPRGSFVNAASMSTTNVAIQCELLPAVLALDAPFVHRTNSDNGRARDRRVPGSRASDATRSTDGEPPFLTRTESRGSDPKVGEAAAVGAYVVESPAPEDAADTRNVSHDLPLTRQTSHGRQSSASATEMAVLERRGGRHSSHSESVGDDHEDEVATVVASDPSGGEIVSAFSSTDAEARRMRLLSSPFVDSINFTMVPCDGQLLLKPSQDKDDKSLGIKVLQALIAEVYQVKKADDSRKDKIRKPRRELHEVLQELLLRQHGVKRVVHQKSWQLVQSVLIHASSDRGVRLFADFLDCTRDHDELSFYLYCSTVLTTAVAEEAQALPPRRLPSGVVNLVRAVRAVELLFGDLPKAMGVARDELEKCTMRSQAILHEFEDWNGSDFDSPGLDPCVHVDDLHRVLLESWRMSALLLDKTVPGFSWRRCVLAFVQHDQHHRGWLDPHEMRDAESVELASFGQSEAEGLRLLDRTSLGAFVFRAVHRCTKAASMPSAAAAEATSATQGRAVAVPRRQRAEAKKAMEEACLNASSLAFESLEQTLGVYLSWLMHSEELRDLSVYHSVKARIYGFRQASGEKRSLESAFELRCLLLLLLAHQFDVQRIRGDITVEHFDWELRSLLQIIREGWQRGAANIAGDAGEFGNDLANLGSYQAVSAAH